MFDRENDEYIVGLMKYAYIEIGFYGMCNALEFARPRFRKLSSKANDDLEVEYDKIPFTGYNKETACEFVFDSDRLTMNQANKMQRNVEEVINNLISSYEKTLL